MKKALSLILALTLCLGLCACGSMGSPKETLSKDEMLAVAESVTIADINSAMNDNFLKAKQQYCGKMLEVTGYVREVKEDHVVLIYYTNHTSLYVNAYLPTEDLLSLSYNNVVKVVGQTSDEIKEESYSVSGYDFIRHIYEMPQAYLVEIIE